MFPRHLNLLKLSLSLAGTSKNGAGMEVLTHNVHRSVRPGRRRASVGFSNGCCHCPHCCGDDDGGGHPHRDGLDRSNLLKHWCTFLHFLSENETLKLCSCGFTWVKGTACLGCWRHARQWDLDPCRAAKRCFSLRSLEGCWCLWLLEQGVDVAA